VALAAYVAGGIAGADINKVGWTAAAYAAPSFMLPFAFSVGPGLLLGGTVGQNVLAVITGIIGVCAIAAAVVGCLRGPLATPARVAAFAAGVLLIFQGLLTAGIGVVLLVVVWIFDRNRESATFA